MRRRHPLPLLIGLIALCFALPQTVEAKKKRKAKAEMMDSGKKKKKRKKKRAEGGKRYPLKVNARPLVLPQGMGQVGGLLTFKSVTVGKKSVNSSDLNLGFDYGVAKGLELGGSTGLALSPDFDFGSGFNLRGGYLLGGQRKGLSLAARLDIPLAFGKDQDVLSSVNASLSTRYRINKKVALHTGDGLISLGLGDKAKTTINVPVGVAYQFNKRFNLRLDTILMSFGSGDTVTLADTVPVTAQAIYAIRRMMDAGIGLNTDLINDSGFTVMALFNYRIR